VEDLREQLKLIVGQPLTISQTPGAAIAIHINGQAFLETGVGYQDRDREAPISTDANFYVYSITKCLIATASLYLVSEGLLDLDAPVQDYLINFCVMIEIKVYQINVPSIFQLGVRAG